MARTYTDNKANLNRGRPRLPTAGVDAETISAREHGRRYQERQYKSADAHYQFARSAYNAAHKRAAYYGVPFDLTLDQIQDLAHQTKTCPVSGETLDYSRHQGLRANSPSLDRHNPALGYTIDNVSIISHWANSARRRLTLAECVQLGRYAAEQISRQHQRDNQIIDALDEAIDALSNAAGYFADRTKLN